MAEQRKSPETGGIDAFALWRQWYEASEQAWTKAIKDVTNTQSYAEAQGKLLEVMLSYQKLMRDAMSSQLGAMNLPTRDDVGRLGELVVGMEEKVDSLDEKVDALAEKMGKIDDKMGKIDELAHKIARLEAQMTIQAEQQAGAGPIQAEQQASAGEAEGTAEAAPERASKPAATRVGRPSAKEAKTD